jgi:tetratricopeptide (TPR) repeat protein
LLCWLLYLKGPGSGGEAYWSLLGTLAVLFAADFGANLVPIGYCDGTMLLHLLLWTQHGQDLYARHLAAKTHNEATQRLVDRDFAGEVQLRRKALDQILARGDAPSVQLGHSYQALAYAQMNHSQRREAEANLRKSLEVFDRCRNPGPIHEANSWKGLESIYRMGQRVDEARQAATSALLAFEKVRAGNLDRVSGASVASAVAQLHADSGHYELGLQEVQLALALTPEGPKYLVDKADLLRTKMRCEAGCGNAVQAGETALEAATLLRSREIPEIEGNRGASALGSLALTAWLAGAGDATAELLRESIQKLEEKGPSSRAVGLRIALVSVLRQEGKFADAEAALPVESDREPERRQAVLHERAELCAETGRVAQAVADARQALNLAEREGENNVKVACAQAKLAEFLLADGNADEAENLACRACDELIPRRHADAAGALITLALIRNNESSEVLAEQAMALVRDAPFMESGTKARALARLSRRLKSLEKENIIIAR